MTLYEPLADALKKIGFLDAKNSDGNTVLHYAIDQEDDDLALQLIDAGADINVTNNNLETPLLNAVNTNNYYMVEVLLDKDALINLADREGSSPLHVAIIDGDLKMCNLLVKHGANVNATNRKGEIPLHVSASHGDIKGVQFMLEHGADIDKESDCGTPLYQAISNGYLDIVGYLIAEGADFDEMDPDGGTVDDALAHLQEHIAEAGEDDDLDHVFAYLRAPGIFEYMHQMIENTNVVRAMAKAGTLEYFVDMFNKGLVPPKGQVFPLLPAAANVSLRAWEDTVRSGMRGLFALHHGGHDLVDPSGPISAYLCEYLVLPAASRAYLFLK